MLKGKQAPGFSLYSSEKAKVNLSDFIMKNVKYVNRNSILKQLEDLPNWENVKFLNEERHSFQKIEEMCCLLTIAKLKCLNMPAVHSFFGIP